VALQAGPLSAGRKHPSLMAFGDCGLHLLKGEVIQAKRFPVSIYKRHRF
jgi:hypothetical protein